MHFIAVDHQVTHTQTEYILLLTAKKDFLFDILEVFYLKDV